MEYINSKTKKLLLTCILTTFMGQIFVNPFSSNFRFSLSVVAFSLFLYWYKELKIIPTAMVVGTFLFVSRVLINTVFTQSPLLTLVGIHYHVIIYYTVFGLLLQTLKFREYYHERLLVLFILSFSDSLSNIIEVLLRRETINIQGISTILFVGLIRGLTTLIVREGAKYYEMLLRREEHEKRYKQLILLTSDLKTEVFFLKKSMDDMEKAMEKSFQLYQELKESSDEGKKSQSLQALSIAKDIHEIKKDYLRVSGGLQKILPEMESYKGMYIKDLLNIIETSYEKYSYQEDKHIDFDFLYFENIFVKQSYALISIINNLVTNGIEAIGDRGSIKVAIKNTKDFLEILVEDDGTGISKDNIEVIFEPGYTTKFDVESGRMNSGIGLTHVAYIVKNTLKGQILVESKDGEGTIFKIMIPLDHI